MPKLVRMAQLSRPYQIGLLVIAVLAAVWVVALRPHNASSSSSSAPPAPAATTVTKAPAASGGSTGQAGAQSKIYHGSAPGVQGLSSAIAKAHGAVATSEKNAAQLEAHSAQASSPTNTAAASAPATAGAAAASVTVTHSTTTTHRGTTSTSVVTATVGKTQPIKARSGAGRTPARQALVERALKEGKVAVILIWNPKGADDVAVHNELVLLEAVHHLIKAVGHTAEVRRALKNSGLELQKKFAAFDARENEVASFGSITRGVQVYGTPTILVVGKTGKTTIITGLTTAYGIEQAIVETRHA